MIFSEPLPFIKEFVDELSQGIQAYSPKNKLSKIQRAWLGFCLTGVLLANKICWTEFERIGLGNYKAAALSWMFRHGKFAWTMLLHVSVALIFARYGIVEGILVGDDSDRQRAKQTKRIFGAYKVFDKKTGGYFNGQTVILLLLVTSKVCIPVGFRFYRPDPVMTAWKKEDEKLKKQGVGKSDRPPKPELNSKYLGKTQLMSDLVQEFQYYHPQIVIKAVLIDALYGCGCFMDRVQKIYKKSQIVSQLRKTQKIFFRNREVSLEKYFSTHSGTQIKLTIRGAKQVTVVFACARLLVKAHGQKRFVVALKYEGESEYRYLVASDMSWRGVDIATVYTLRWLVEVFFEDWKLHEGWGQQAQQPDYEGSSRSLTLSLLLDHALLLHPEQLARVENKLPAFTVGSLQRKSQIDALIAFLRTIVNTKNPYQELEKLLEVSKRLFPLVPSSKHMNGRDLGRLGPTPSLKYRAKACAA